MTAPNHPQKAQPGDGFGADDRLDAAWQQMRLWHGQDLTLPMVYEALGVGCVQNPSWRDAARRAADISRIFPDAWSDDVHVVIREGAPATIERRHDSNPQPSTEGNEDDGQGELMLPGPPDDNHQHREGVMDWFRSHHGAPTDPKWLVIARRSNSRPGEVAAIWWALLDYASQNTTRGSISGFDVETLAGFYGYDEAMVEVVITALVDKGLIVDGCIASWDRRQSASDSSSERTRAWRHRSRSGNDAVTVGDGHVTAGDALDSEQSRGDEREGALAREAHPPTDLPDEWREEAQRQRADLPQADLADQWQRFRNLNGDGMQTFARWRGRWLNWARDAKGSSTGNGAAEKAAAPAGSEIPRSRDDAATLDRRLWWGRPRDWWQRFSGIDASHARSWVDRGVWNERWLGGPPGSSECKLNVELARAAIDERAKRPPSALPPPVAAASIPVAEPAVDRSAATPLPDAGRGSRKPDLKTRHTGPPAAQQSLLLPVAGGRGPPPDIEDEIDDGRQRALRR